MTKRTTPKDAAKIESAMDIEDVVVDKRHHWRASAEKARRRQRRYQKLITQEILFDAQDSFSNE
ncbi:MAG: hypothetical protein WA981_07125 [Glaciecola sp.]